MIFNSILIMFLVIMHSAFLANFTWMVRLHGTFKTNYKLNYNYKLKLKL